METIAPEKYVELYNSYKAELSQRAFNKWTTYQVYMDQAIAEKLKTFVSVNEYDIILILF